MALTDTDRAQENEAVTGQDMSRFFGPDSPRIYIVRGLPESLSMLERALLSYVGYHIVARTHGLTRSHQGEVWLVQRQEDVAAFLGVKHRTLENSVKRLRDKKLLATTVLGNQRESLWKVNMDNILKLNIPQNRGDGTHRLGALEPTKLGDWIYKKKEIQNSGVSKETPRQAAPGVFSSELSSLENTGGLHVKGKLPQTKPKKEVLPDEYVEHWNSLPHTPKCQPGSKAYETCRTFFKAYLHYEIGSGRWILPDEYKQCLKNINQENAHKKGKRPTQRPHEEMIHHIETAAFAFNLEYQPQDKARLKKLGLRGFLYNTYSKISGQSSAFCKFIHSPPLRLDDTRGLVAEKLSDDEWEVISAITEIYCYGRSRTDFELSDDEFVAATRVAKAILRKFYYVLPDYTSWYGNLSEFLSCWATFATDGLYWPKMPITALHPSKKMWSEFMSWLGVEDDSDDIQSAEMRR